MEEQAFHNTMNSEHSFASFSVKEEQKQELREFSLRGTKFKFSKSVLSDFTGAGI